MAAKSHPLALVKSGGNLRAAHLALRMPQKTQLKGSSEHVKVAF